MTRDQRAGLAAQRAEEYAPRPQGGAIAAGVCGATMALVGDFVVSGFYGWSVAANAAVALAVTVLGFAIVFGVYVRRRAHNKRAIVNELALMETAAAEVEAAPTGAESS